MQTVQIFNKDQSVPKQWKKLMSSGKNKESLMVFNHWSFYLSSKHNSSLPCMHIASRSKYILLTPGVSPNDPVVGQEIPELTSDHEEADTRVLLHSKHAAGSHERIIIKTPDTDVFVLCTHSRPNSCSVLRSYLKLHTELGRLWCTTMQKTIAI